MLARRIRKLLKRSFDADPWYSVFVGIYVGLFPQLLRFDDELGAAASWLITATSILGFVAVAVGFWTILRAYRKHEIVEELILNPIEFFGLVASLIEIANASRALTPNRLASVYREEVDGGRAVAVPDEDLAIASAAVLHALDTAPDFVDRIQKRCLQKYQDSVRDVSVGEQELYEVRVRTRRCVCENIKMARDDNQGDFPDGPFRDWWRQFDCQFL